MSILFVLLMFLLIITISYFRGRNEMPVREPGVRAQVPRMEREYGFSDPAGLLLPSWTHLGPERRSRASTGGSGQLRREFARKD